MQEKTFKIMWDDFLGQEWMNIYNLELCLFSQNCIGGKAKDKVKIVETKRCDSLGKLTELCKACDQRFKCWTEQF